MGAGVGNAAKCIAALHYGVKGCQITAMAIRPLILACLAAALSGVPALAADFYQGKTLTVIVGYAPGGGVDASARAMTRHLGRFIPGQPNVVVQNMEGAAGIVAVNHLNRRVAPDGLTLAVPGRSWFIEAIVKRPGITFDPTKFAYIGSPGTTAATAFLRKSTGIASIDQLKASKKTVTFGALGSTTPTAMAPSLLAASGAPIKVVLGYVSTARILLALEQSEIDGSFTVGNALATRKELFEQVTPIVQTGTAWPGVPYIGDVIRPDLKPVLELVMAPDSIGVPLVGPPGVPADVTGILRKAFQAMMQDKDYQADATRVELPVGSPIDGAQIEQQMRSLVALATPSVIEEFRKLAAGK
jgi:tripartite-type tricarboxylate transporter receptor subunit TctC